MLHKTGRHRRPRQAPPFIIAAGVASSAIAIPLLGASAANAADTPWDRVAECESGGSWSTNSHDGYYGGLLISQADWEKYGGLTYAQRADEASRSQQIAVAEKILASQGTAPWATCAVPSELTRHSGSVPVDTGVANDPSSTRDSDRSSHFGSGSYEHGLSNSGPWQSNLSDSASRPTPSARSSIDPSDPAAASPSSSGPSDSPVSISTDPAPTLPAAKECCVTSDEPTGPGRGNKETVGTTPSTPPEAGESDTGQAIPSWSLVDTGTDTSTRGASTGRHRGDRAQEAPKDGPVSSGRHASRTDKPMTGEVHTVRAGDTLTSIAHALGVRGGWPALYAQNEAVIGPNPDHILPGQSVKAHYGPQEGAAAPDSVGAAPTGHEPGYSNR
jgi:resuscitation-promoting factor RpfA